MNKGKLTRHFRTAVLLMLLLGTCALTGLIGCSRVPAIQAQDLSKEVQSQGVSGKETDDKFVDSVADFSFELFKRTYDKKKNSLVSPLSVMLALSMTANGAANETLAQMEKVLGGDIMLDELNEYLYTYVKGLPSIKKSRLNIANSIWYRDEEQLQISRDFLQRNADYYNAAIYKAPFDDQTLKDVNNWVKVNTDGMIEKVLDKIKSEDMMYLINAVVFDAQWKYAYKKSDIKEGTFTTVDGKSLKVDFMNSRETGLIRTDNAIGFIKPYHDDHYSFVALLPDEGLSLNEFVASLSGDDFISMIENREPGNVIASMPRFSYEYEIVMNEPLIDMGMDDAFSPDDADFSRMMAGGGLYIGEVLHKTYISVDDKGTKAAAVTKVTMELTSAPNNVYVTLNRPFVYAIVDNATNLPIFIGVLMEPVSGK